MSHLLPAVTKWVSNQPLKMYIGGEWVEASDGATFVTRDPGTGKVIAPVASGEQSDVDDAVKAAQKAFVYGGWAEMPANDRAVILHRLADLIDKRKEVL